MIPFHHTRFVDRDVCEGFLAVNHISGIFAPCGHQSASHTGLRQLRDADQTALFPPLALPQVQAAI